MKIIILSCLFISIAIFGQKPISLPIEKLIIDSTLSFSSLSNNNISFTFPTYIINDNYVIFQKDAKNRKILSTDLKSFKRPKTYESSIFALDKTGVFVNGNYVKTDTTGFVSFGKTLDGSWIWKNNKSVYTNTTKLNDINSSKFERLKMSNGSSYHGHFKDDKNVYYFDKIVNGADAKTAIAIDSESFYDKSYYMYLVKRNISKVFL
ncbi:MAG TPA: DKNYY domain-containing protein [Chryseobacterium sp.]